MTEQCSNKWLNDITLGWQALLKVLSENRTAFRKIRTAVEDSYTFVYELPSRKFLKKKKNGYRSVIGWVIC